MSILQDIISSISVDVPVRDVTRGIHWTAVTSRRCGLASTMIYDCKAAEDKELSQTSYLEMSAVKLAERALSVNTAESSVGLAAINSLIDIDQCIDLNAADYMVMYGHGKNIAIIGHFPFVDRLKNIAKNVWVVEKRPRVGDYPEEQTASLLEQSDLVAISSTTLINHTLEGILALCPPGCIKILLGPTTPLTDILFDHGIDVISGSIVTDPDAALLSIRQGKNFKEIKTTGSVKLVTRIKNEGDYTLK